MIGFLTGSLIEKSPTQVVLDVSGIGYEIAIPLSTFEKLTSTNERCALFTHLHVREDVLQLYGFATKDEKQLFQHLISVTGVGPKLALSVLSGCTVEGFCRYIQNNEIASLTAIPGIGKKTAERLVMELRDRLAHFKPAESGRARTKVDRVEEEAILALVSLGYPRAAAEKALAAVIAEGQGGLAVEDLIKQALRRI